MLCGTPQGVFFTRRSSGKTEAVYTACTVHHGHLQRTDGGRRVVFNIIQTTLVP